MALSSLLSAAVLLASSVAVADTQSSTAYATYINFATTDILNGDDGLPPHPLQGLPYGYPTYPITVDGNGREQVEAHLTFFEGKYWMHAATWGCGGSLFVYSHALTSNTYPPIPVYPPGDYGEDGNCGIKTYSSVDFTNWVQEDFYQPSITVANVTKPVVRYSNATGKYVMYMGGNGFNNFFYATSDSPAGPWSNPPSIMQGTNINHDFDVAVGPDGTHYMVSDTFVGVNTRPDQWSVPVWDIWIHQLAPNLTATIDSTAVRIRTAQQLLAQNLTLEAVGFFYHDGHYYINFGFTCQNCAGYIYNYHSTSPFGPYADGGFISQDGCGGQNKGANVLPSPDGPVVLAGNLGYRTGPTDLVFDGQLWHADNHQAASSTYFFPLEFNADHTLKNYTCPATIRVPLATNVTASPPPPVPFRLDCRVRNWQSVRAVYDLPKPAGTTLEFDVWQRTDNLGPTTNAGPVLDGPLGVTLDFASGPSASFSWAASNVSWVPAKISLDVGGGRQLTGITLTTNATNGCYGTLAEPRVEKGSKYGKVVNGMFTESPGAQLYVYQF